MLINILKAPRFFGIAVICLAIFTTACQYNIETKKNSRCSLRNTKEKPSQSYYYQLKAKFWSDSETAQPPCTQLSYCKPGGTFDKIYFYEKANQNILLEVKGDDGTWIPVFGMTKHGSFKHWNRTDSESFVTISSPKRLILHKDATLVVNYRSKTSIQSSLAADSIGEIIDEGAKIFKDLGKISKKSIEILIGLVNQYGFQDTVQKSTGFVELFNKIDTEYSGTAVLTIVVMRDGEAMGQIGTLEIFPYLYQSLFNPVEVNAMPPRNMIAESKLLDAGRKEVVVNIKAIQREFNKTSPDPASIYKNIDEISKNEHLTNRDKAICLWMATADAKQLRNDPKFEKTADLIRSEAYIDTYSHYAKEPFPSAETVLMANYKKKYATIIENAHGVTGMRTLLMASSETDYALRELSMNETERMNMLTQIFGGNSLFMNYAESRPGYFRDHKGTLADLGLQSTPIAAFNTQTNTMAPGAFGNRANELGEYLQSTNGTPLGLTDYVTLRDMDGGLAFVQHGQTKRTLLGDESAARFGCYIQYVMTNKAGNQTVADFIQSVRGWENLPFQGIMAYYVLHRARGHEYKEYHALLLDMTSEETQGIGYEKAICGMYDYQVDKDFIAQFKDEFFAPKKCNLIDE